MNSLSELYKAITSETDGKDRALLLIELRTWLNKSCNFDPRSGHELSQNLDSVLLKIRTQRLNNHLPDCNVIQDRLFRILEHVNDALVSIIKNINNKTLREHALVPIYAAREVDSVSIQWLSKQTGRNLREKLAGKPYIKAVRRRSSADTIENRLLKAFVIKLEDLLFKREDLYKALSINCDDELLLILQRWLRTEEAKEIGLWSNIPPNNTLLQHKHYRKIWDAWLWLQRLDDDIQRDTQRINLDLITSIYWSVVSELKQSKQIRIIQQPVSFDYDNYLLSTTFPTLEGYFYPFVDSSLLHGNIKNISLEKKFGFVYSKNKNKDYFFHANDLNKRISLDDFNTGDSVSFILGKNDKGECAKKVEFKQHINPGKFACKFQNNTIEIKIGSQPVFTLTPSDVELALQLNPKPLNELINQIIRTVLRYFGIVLSSPSSTVCPSVLSKKSVIDLFSIRPDFVTDSESDQIRFFPYRLLLQQWKDSQNNIIDIDCAKSNAIKLSENILSCSLYSLFSESLEDDKEFDYFKKQAAMFFSNKIKKHLAVDSLTYLVPDAINEFSLEMIRRSINFNYPNATPLPRSIAAVFDWQDSTAFKKSNIKENDVFIVIDINNKGYSFTPIVCKYNSDLKNKLPDTRGITWERHPSVFIKKYNISNKLEKVITEKHFTKASILLELLGLQGISKEAGQLSFSDDDSNWYDIPEELTNLSHTYSLEYKELLNEICNIPIVKNHPNKKLYLLPLSSVIKRPRNLKDSVYWSGAKHSLVKGGLTLTDWQEGVDAPLWRDHLPELSIEVSQNGRIKPFFLVKDTTVIPLRGKQESIPIDQTFTLRANKSAYYFPLKIGDGKQAAKYHAELKSPAFPLAEDTECSLKMTYTYGSDNPYQLRFVPKYPEKVGFHSVFVQWRSIDTMPPADLSSLPIPSFPKKKKWSDFEKYPKDDGKGYSDLIDWVQRDLSLLININNFLSNNDSSKRIYDDEKFKYRNWRTDKNGKHICWVNYSFGEVFFHENNFEKFVSDAAEVSFDLEKQNGRDGYRALNITLGKTLPKSISNKLKKSMRFPVLTIWNNGHSLSEPDAPNDFRNIVKQGINSALSLRKLDETTTALKEELFFFLSCLHKDTPIEIAELLVKYSKDKQNLRKYHRHIAFAIGSGELDWQKELLRNTLIPIDNEGLTRSMTLEILAIAFWRVEEIIDHLTEDDIKGLLSDLQNTLEFDLDKLKNTTKFYIVSTLCKHLELLLALLRARKSEDENIKVLLSPDNKIIKKLIETVDKAVALVVEKNIQIKSRIDLEINKPDQVHKTPDLLYALKMYLTGDDWANTIEVIGVSDE